MADEEPDIFGTTTPEERDRFQGADLATKLLYALNSGDDLAPTLLRRVINSRPLIRGEVIIRLATLALSEARHLSEYTGLDADEVLRRELDNLEVLMLELDSRRDPPAT